MRKFTSDWATRVTMQSRGSASGQMAAGSAGSESTSTSMKMKMVTPDCAKDPETEARRFLTQQLFI